MERREGEPSRYAGLPYVCARGASGDDAGGVGAGGSECVLRRRDDDGPRVEVCDRGGAAARNRRESGRSSEGRQPTWAAADDRDDATEVGQAGGPDRTADC